MPIYEYTCTDCGAPSEKLVMNAGEQLQCDHCGGTRLQRRLSRTANYSGASRSGLPGPKDTGCCGTSPAMADCAGPGSCCGKR